MQSLLQSRYTPRVLSQDTLYDLTISIHQVERHCGLLITHSSRTVLNTKLTLLSLQQNRYDCVFACENARDPRVPRSRSTMLCPVNPVVNKVLPERDAEWFARMVGSNGSSGAFLPAARASRRWPDVTRGRHMGRGGGAVKRRGVGKRGEMQGAVLC